MKQVTEQDLRMPEFRDARPEDLEWRADGKIVRKDRWEQGIRSIAGIFGTTQEFEIAEIVERVRYVYYLAQVPDPRLALFIKHLSAVPGVEQRFAGHYPKGHFDLHCVYDFSAGFKGEALYQTQWDLANAEVAC